MNQPSASRAASAAAVSLGCFCLAAGAFLPPWNEKLLGNVGLMALLGLAIAVSLIVHLIFVGLLARRTGRSPWRWGLLALLTLPIGSAVGLILYEWSTQADQPEPATGQR